MRKFTVKNESFLCEHCAKKVPPHSSSSRNHCPHCLHSKHVDINPGDRANPCGALLRPTGYELSGKKGLVLTFVCTSCGETGRNIAADDDDYDTILGLGQP